MEKEWNCLPQLLLPFRQAEEDHHYFYLKRKEAHKYNYIILVTIKSQQNEGPSQPRIKCPFGGQYKENKIIRDSYKDCTLSSNI